MKLTPIQLTCFLTILLFSCKTTRNASRTKDLGEKQKTASVQALSSEEDQIFDQHREPPNALLKRFFQDSRILVLEISNHTSYKRYLIIQELLKSLGESVPRYIVLERSHDNAGFYQDLSAAPLSSLNLGNYFKAESEKIASLCFSEWAYGVDQFMPTIQKMNEKRTSKNRTIVTSVDGVFNSVPQTWPWDGSQSTFSDFHLSQGTCAYPESEFFPALATSGTREDMTKANFERLYNSLRKEEKIILVYHHAHAIDSFESCVPFLDGDNKKNFISKKAPLGWLARFLFDHPEVRREMKMVLLDEKDPEHNPDGVLNFSARQAARHPNTSFGIDLSHFKGILPERGLDAFADTAFLKTYHGGQHESSQTVPELFDGIVYSHDAASAYLLKDSHSYMPEICTPESDQESASLL